MTITFPITAPVTSTINESSVRLYAGSVVKTGRSPYTLETQVYEYDSGKWGLEIGIDPLDREEAAPWYAFLAALRGKKGTFLWGPDLLGTPLGAGGGTPLVNGAGQAGSLTLVTDGWPNSTLVLKKGDIFSIDNRMYLVTADATTNGSGQVTIDIWPQLKVHADNSALDLSNPVETWRLTTNSVLLYETPSNKKFNISFSAEGA